MPKNATLPPPAIFPVKELPPPVPDPHVNSKSMHVYAGHMLGMTEGFRIVVKGPGSVANPHLQHIAHSPAPCPARQTKPGVSCRFDYLAQVFMMRID